LSVIVESGNNTPERAVEPATNGNAASILGSIKTRAKLQQEEHLKEFPVGGEFGNLLKIKYKVLEQGPLDSFIARRQAQAEKPQMTALSMQFMAQACLCLVAYDESGKHSIVLEDGEGVMRLEHRLAEFLEIVPPNPNPIAPAEPLSATEVIMLLFGKNAMAVVAHADELMTWMQDPSKKTDVGKFSGLTGPMSSPSVPSAESTPGT
jgi:hypothetical protein